MPAQALKNLHGSLPTFCRHRGGRSVRILLPADYLSFETLPTIGALIAFRDSALGLRLVFLGILYCDCGSLFGLASATITGGFLFGTVFGVC